MLLKMKSVHLAAALILCVFLLNPPSSLAQEQFRGKVVTSISYDPANQPIDARDLRRMQLVEPNRPLDPEQVATSIDNLFATGLYDDIQVDAEPAGDGVAIRFVTRARLFVGHVDVLGKTSDPPSRGVILGDAGLYLGTPFNPDDVETARRTIEQVMRQNGLYRGSVGVGAVIDPDTHQVTVRFYVQAGKRARYETPVVTGDAKLPLKTIIKATGWRTP